jgi:hypothetical protein
MDMDTVALRMDLGDLHTERDEHLDGSRQRDRLSLGAIGVQELAEAFRCDSSLV